MLQSEQTTTGELTRLLRAWTKGDLAALAQLTPIVHGELHRLARRQMAVERQGHLLQPSALVNEAYLKLMGDAVIEWADRNHFFAVLSRVMRQILTDFARGQARQKRGQRAHHVAIDEGRDVKVSSTLAMDDMLAVDQALSELTLLDERQAKVVEMRFFGGLEIAEIAGVLGVSEPTVGRDWRLARAWLFHYLASGSA